MEKYVYHRVFGKSLRHFYWMYLCAALVFALALPAQSVWGENLMQVYKLAKEHDPTFKGDRYKHEASPEMLKQAYSELWPKVTAEGYYQKTRQKIIESDVAIYSHGVSHFPTKGYTLTLTQPLLRYSSIVRVYQAKEEVKRADVEFEANKQDLIMRVAEAYIEALSAQDKLIFDRAEETSVKLHFELAQRRYNMGLAPITDFHDAKARLAFVTVGRIKSENKLEDALEGLTEVTGSKIKNLSRLKADITEITVESKPESAKGGMSLVNPDPDDVDKWINAALKQNLELDVQRKAVEIARQEVKRQKTGHWPTLNAVGRYNREDAGGSMFAGGSDVETQEAFLQLNVPLFEGFYVVSKTREAAKLYKAATQDLEKEIRAVKRETYAVFRGVKSAITSVEAFKQSVVSNQIALEAKKEGFKSGLFNSLAVLDAESDLCLAKQELAQSQYDYILYSLGLKKAGGTLNDEDLVLINQWLEE